MVLAIWAVHFMLSASVVLMRCPDMHTLRSSVFSDLLAICFRCGIGQSQVFPPPAFWTPISKPHILLESREHWKLQSPGDNRVNHWIR